MVNIIKRIMEKPQNSMSFDSVEEGEFYAWCLEAKEHGFIEDFVYHPEPFKLSERQSTTRTKVYYTKVRRERREKVEEVFLFHPHEYTPDFKLSLSDKWLDKFSTALHHDDFNVAWIDVKGTFGMFHDDKSFSINQKWVYQKYGVVVNKVVPKRFFPKTWVPTSARYTDKTGKVRKAYVMCPTIEDVL